MKNRFEQKNSEITIVSRETSSRPTALCPSSNARLNHRRKAEELAPSMDSTALSAIKPG